MLITCTGCNAKIRAPETMSGKRVRCPRCATEMRVPPKRIEPMEETVSRQPLPPPPPVEPLPEPDEPIEFIDDDVTHVTTAGAKPPPIKRKRASSNDDDDDEAEEEERPRRSRRDDEDDDDRDEEDDDLGSPRRRRIARDPVNNLAMTSMVMGIVSVSLSGLGCCCGACGIFIEVVAMVCGIIAIALGVMGKTPGSETYAQTGIICGSVSLALGILAIVVIILWVGVNVGHGILNMNNMNNMNNGNNMNINPRKGR
jgi:hypothetical protein